MHYYVSLIFYTATLFFLVGTSVPSQSKDLQQLSSASDVMVNKLETGYISQQLNEDNASTSRVFEHEAGKASAESQNTVQFGLFITNLYDINFTDNEFTVEFWSWFRSTTEGYRPRDRTEITNAKQFQIRNDSSQLIEDVYLHSQVFKGVIKQQWDITSFPFDTQKLRIVIEDTIDVEQNLRFEIDPSSALAANIIPDGWNLVDFSITQSPKSYPTTFGDTRTPQGEPYVFSKIEAVLTLQREGTRLFISSFMGLFVATGLILVVFSINTFATARAVVPLQPRITLCVGALFAAVGAIYSMSAKVPYTTAFTLSDSLQITTFLIITLGIISSVVSDLLAHKGKETLRRQMMIVVWLIFISIHVGVNAFLILSSQF